MPGAAQRVDVAAVEAELGDSSFVLDEIDADGADSVQVHLRLRPTAEDEECAWRTTLDTATIMLDPGIAAKKLQPNAGMAYHFDGLHTDSSNASLYASLARPLVQSVLRGYNALVFAYGQTASGKTFTLSGGANEEPGIIPRAVCDIFQGICQGSSKREYLVRLSYLEIWNEIVKDLLDPTSTPQVRDDRRRGPNAVFIAPLQEEIVSSPSQVFDLLARGEENRHIGATDWNERSSRSHTCLKITVESWERDALHDDEAKVGRHYRISELHLIDLAGSERNSFYSANRRAEGANINKSLLSLSKVIYALSERQATGRPAPAHIPYRDSKLTRILQNSLNGSARVAVVCTLNPSPAMVEESLGTINFARRIKHVAVRAQPNEFDGDLSVLVGAPCTETQALLARYRAEMGALRAKVASLQQAPRTPTPSTPDSAPHTPTQSKPVSLDALQARLDQLGTLILRGGSVQESSAAPHPVSPAKRRGFTFDDPLPRVQEKLHAALTKIGRLERALATRIMLPEMADEKDRLIGDLLQQVRELEVVCQAQREDDAPSYEARLDEAEEKIAARDAFLEELTVECARLRRANKELVLLAHQETARMVEAAQPKRRSPIMSLFAPQLRPATVLGMAPCASTPLQSSPLRAWKQHKASIVSIDASESESSSDLSNSGLAELLEE
ncbi:Kip2p [Malassezia vespertilionis]|uniref:Kinesin-like protein n=2 Tax=Malassezia vespertilionis TaxID=2020962 RepID=A0A2N1JB95_9BASI|nr:Kip2p [Malassezia vespertilionis]